MIEIERKFKVSHTQFLENISGTMISQGYLSNDPDRTVRVRTKGAKGYLTIKGKSNESGTSRFEWETEIDLVEAKELLKLCLPAIIEKTRYEINFQGNLWEVDVFKGLNKGLIIAEIELDSEDENFEKPSWLGEEVTGDPHYYNSYLGLHPFTSWPERS